MRVKSVIGDLQIVAEQHSNVIRNNALPFRLFIVVRIIGFLLSYAHFTRASLWLYPYQLTSLELWRILTSVFCGHNLIELGWTIWSFHLGTNLVRQNNTNESIFKIYAITQVLSTFAIAIIGYLSYALFGSIKLFWMEPLVGPIPINTAVLVLMKQFLPDSIVFSTPIGRLKYTHLPFFALIVSLALSFMRLTYYITSIQILVSIQISWTYLRFYRPHETEDIYGDGSEHFTWASLFPSRTQPIFTIIGRICFRILARMNICKRRVRHVDLNSLQSVAVGMNLPALENSAKDAERRRQKALKELNDRLHKTRNASRNNYGAWDEDEDEKTPEVKPEKKEETSELPDEQSSDVI